ncbi:hypothetical protein PB2503_02187 [Parvularcula bermudensis HTCC2503]|uniref:UrcA family protein n=1 Tax=Parvularcula bermudensis (strain ATCC BAA-594 / HTCC2503 / KCTC 12087) TaxID=314260 RepID=E0TC83_PARBH|nr:UrcA family protein [Parvularcula bermudensis]ADM08516.1 hypothetical protein PB2503_02187 [Parvularcula bermudensis HTCC2503]
MTRKAALAAVSLLAFSTMGAMGSAQAQSSISYDFYFSYDRQELVTRAGERAVRQRLAYEATHYCRALTAQRDDVRVGPCKREIIAGVEAELRTAIRQVRVAQAR